MIVYLAIMAVIAWAHGLWLDKELDDDDEESESDDDRDD